MPMINALLARVGFATLAISTLATAQVPPRQSPLAQFPGFGHDHQADRARYRRQEIAREQAIARCMQEAGFPYTPTPSRLNPQFANAKAARAAQQDPNLQYAASLVSAERTRYYLALYGVPDPNDPSNLWDPRSPSGGGCWGEALREIPSVYAAQSQLNEAFLAMVRSVNQDPRVQTAERTWADCMQNRGYQYASPRDMTAAVHRAGLRGPPPAAERERHRQALAAGRECRVSTGLDAVVETVRVERETEFVLTHKAILENHAAVQRSQILPPQ